MGRKVVYNKIVDESKLSKVNPDNIQLGNDFLEYLSSIDRSETTINAYKNDLKIFWVYCLDELKNKFFVNLTKREIVKFQNHCLTTWKWSPARVRRMKSTLSSLSNYIENMLDDEFDFRPIVRKIENPQNVKVMDKSIFTVGELKPLLDKLIENEEYDKACMLSLAMNNGRRKSELPRMKVSDFTDDNIIYGSLYKSSETVKTKGRGSRGKQLFIYTLVKPFKPYLDLWLNYRREHNITSEWLIPEKSKDGYIDKQIPISTLDSWAKSFSKMLDKPFYWHSMRHLFVTMLSEYNIPDGVIQDIVGWDSAEMCRVYCDLDVDKKFGKYFGEDGIKTVEMTSIADL